MSLMFYVLLFRLLGSIVFVARHCNLKRINGCSAVPLSFLGGHQYLFNSDFNPLGTS